MPEESKTFEFKDLDEETEKQLDENIREHIAPEQAEPQKAESKPQTPQKPKKESYFKRLQNELPKKFLRQPRQVAGPKQKKLDRLKSFWLECKRVLRVTRKPDKMEFRTIVKVSALGMAIIGAIGFALTFVKELLF